MGFASVRSNLFAQSMVPGDQLARHVDLVSLSIAELLILQITTTTEAGAQVKA